VTDVFRAPMRSRRDDVALQSTIDRALTLGLVGFGDAGADERLSRRIARFADVDDGSFVWTRDADGLFWLGRIDGPLLYDDDGATVDLVHVRPCRWIAQPMLEQDVPAAVLNTFARGGRNFQQTHDVGVGPETQGVWDAKVAEPS
jgi:hypothetical protein